MARFFDHNDVAVGKVLHDHFVMWATDIRGLIAAHKQGGAFVAQFALAVGEIHDGLRRIGQTLQVEAPLGNAFGEDQILEQKTPQGGVRKVLCQLQIGVQAAAALLQIQGLHGADDGGMIALVLDRSDINHHEFLDQFRVLQGDPHGGFAAHAVPDQGQILPLVLTRQSHDVLGHDGIAHFVTVWRIAMIAGVGGDHEVMFFKLARDGAPVDAAAKQSMQDNEWSSSSIAVIIQGRSHNRSSQV